MSFQTNNDDDQDQDQATTTLSQASTTMFQFATTMTDHGSMLMEYVQQHQPFENGHDEFPNHSSNSDSLKRIREEQPQEEEKEEKEEDETSSSSSLALATIHQDEAAVLHALVAFSLFSALPTVLLFSIFSYLHFNEYERLSVRNLCRLFHTVLPGPTCAGVYTIFPHPNHASLNSLMNCLNEMARVEGSNVPEHLFLANGVHVIEDEDHGGWGVINVVNLNLPISIIGESREHCIVMGGLCMNGKKEDDVNVSNLTLRDSRGDGVRGKGASIHLDNVSVENSGKNGVEVYWTQRNTMTNCNVSHSKGNGLVAQLGGLMTIDGNDTTIHHNCIDEGWNDYGLNAGGVSSSIHLVSPLTKEMISTNNHGGRHYGSGGTIKTITTSTKKEEK